MTSSIQEWNLVTFSKLIFYFNLLTLYINKLHVINNEYDYIDIHTYR